MSALATHTHTHTEMYILTHLGHIVRNALILAMVLGPISGGDGVMVCGGVVQ